MTPDPGRDEIAKARRGDREALNRLLAANHERLSRLAHARLGPALRKKVRTSDILQSTYLDVVLAVRTFDGETSDDFASWVGRILENNIRDKGRYFGARKRRSEGVRVPVAETPLAQDASPVSQAAISEELLLVDRAFEALPEDYRRVLTLCVKEGRPHREASAALDRSEAATRVLLSRARAALVLEVERRRSVDPDGARRSGAKPESTPESV